MHNTQFCCGKADSIEVSSQQQEEKCIQCYFWFSDCCRLMRNCDTNRNMGYNDGTIEPTSHPSKHKNALESPPHAKMKTPKWTIKLTYDSLLLACHLGNIYKLYCVTQVDPSLIYTDQKVRALELTPANSCRRHHHHHLHLHHHRRPRPMKNHTKLNTFASIVLHLNISIDEMNVVMLSFFLLLVVFFLLHFKPIGLCSNWKNR